MILTAPVVDPIGLPAMPIPIPLKELSISRMTLVQKILISRIKLWCADAVSKVFALLLLLTHMASWVSSSEASQELLDRSQVLVFSMENSQDFPWRGGYYCSILSS